MDLHAVPPATVVAAAVNTAAAAYETKGVRLVKDVAPGRGPHFRFSCPPMSSPTLSEHGSRRVAGNEAVLQVSDFDVAAA